MNPRKFNEIVPDAMSLLDRMIEEAERKEAERETRKARSVDRGAIRVKRSEKRARQLTLALKR